jgi:hypothetical protein
MHPISRTLIALALAAAGVTTSHAATVDVKFDTPIFNGTPGPGPSYDVVTITYPKLVGQGTQSATVAAGRFQGTASNLVGVEASIFVDGLDDLFMYCYDIYEQVGAGWNATYTINFDGATARTLDFLGAVNAVLSTGQAQTDPYAWLHPTSGTMAAAIQLGIWESRYDDGDWSLAGGSFRASGVEAQTSTYLNSFFAAIGTTPSLHSRYVMTLEANGVQDMITGDPPALVPEPGTMALFGLAALGLLGSRRRPTTAT